MRLTLYLGRTERYMKQGNRHKSTIKKRHQRRPLKQLQMPHAGAGQDVGSLSRSYQADDSYLLDRSLTQWQFGDWESLVRLSVEDLECHHDRAKLALLAAVGHQQIGNIDQTRYYCRLAREWGCGKKLLSQVLIGGVYNTLGRAAASAGQEQRALEHLKEGIRVGQPGSDVRLLVQARIGEQLKLDRSMRKRLIDAPVATGRVEKLQPEQGSKKPLAEHDTDVNNEAGPKPKFSSDADIDDFIADIAPFFNNRPITYVDVGAYVGEVLLKILATRKIKVREAHLIEPNPDSYQKLKKSVEDCSVSSCNTYHFGISNQSGMARFRDAKSMTKKLSMDIDINETSNVFETECYRLDDVAKLFTDNRVDLLKLDVEGEELDVLLSADQLLKNNKIDVLYVEVGLNREGTQQTYFGDLDVLLQGYGYRIFKIYEQKNEWIEDSPVLRRCNAAYMSSRFAARNPYSLTTG